MSDSDGMVRTHRQNNYWEPTFDQEGEPLTREFDWDDLVHNNGPKNCVCKPFTIDQLENNVIKRKQFIKCDFNGNFTFDKTFRFSGCVFDNCHFGWSNWKNVKFQNCEFKNCTFGITKLVRCQFTQDCIFENIYISSNETVFQNCIIDATRVIPNIQTNTENEGVLNQRNTTVEYQKYRLAGTKATVAKNIMNSLKNYGDDDLYISSIRVYSNQYNFSRIRRSWHFIKTGSFWDKVKNFLWIIPRTLELILISAFGILNRWGHGIGRITLVGILLWVIFGTIYTLNTLDFSFSALTTNIISNSFLKSFDILTLVGYSKYNLVELGTTQKVLHLVNLLLGISWFSLLFPTIFARTSKYYD